jgi:hypothetical protein
MNSPPTNEQFRHAGLTKEIIGCFYDVYNELGFGFIESVYENLLCFALRAKGLFDADVMVSKLILLELKTARGIDNAHLGQLMNYLKATKIEVGLLLNFGPKPEFKRVVFGNDRKLGASTPA